MNNENQTQNPEETPQERYERMVNDLVLVHGFSKRKARRYLDAFAKRESARIIREGRARQEKLRKEGKLIDTEELSKQLDNEFQEELKEAGIQLQNSTYSPPTTDF
jgi:hypothetical protein